MNRKTGTPWVTVACAIFLLARSGRALAYLDPSSGSLLLQAVAAGFLALMVTVRLYWHRLLAFFGLRARRQETGDSDAAPPDAG